MDLSIAVLGASGIAASHVESLRRIDGVDVRVVYSRSEGRARGFAARSGIPDATGDLSHALDDVDAVLIASEPSRHADLAARAMERGKHILLEKPLDVDLDAASALARRAAGYSRVVSVVSQKRFDPVLLRMEEDFRKLAGPAMIDLRVFWQRAPEYYAAGSGWRRTQSDFFVNQGIHWLDVLNWFFGEPCEVRAFATAGRPEIACTDRAAAVLRYRDGSLATVAGGSFVTRQAPDTFVIRCADGVLDHQAISREPQRARKGARFLRPRARADSPSLAPLDLQARDFVEAIREGRAPTTTIDQALRALRLALALSNRLKYDGGDEPTTSEHP